MHPHPALSQRERVPVKQGFGKEDFTRRIGLVRVLYFVFMGRGRLPSKTRPLVNWSCEPTISVFDPPTYVVASLRKPLRVSDFDALRRTEKLIHHTGREFR